MQCAPVVLNQCGAPSFAAARRTGGPPGGRRHRSSSEPVIEDESDEYDDMEDEYDIDAESPPQEQQQRGRRQGETQPCRNLRMDNALEEVPQMREASSAPGFSIVRKLTVHVCILCWSWCSLVV